MTEPPGVASRLRRHAGRALLVLAVLGGVPSALSAQESDETESAYSDPESVKEASEFVLGQPEFRNLRRLRLEADAPAEPLKSKEELKKERQAEAPRSSGGPSFLAGLFGGAVSMVVVLVLAVVVGAIVLLIVLGLRQWERTERDAAKPEGDAASDDEPEPAFSPGERPADAWLAAARAAAAAGRFDEALSLLLLGAMGHAERAGLIRPRRGLTYRDYLRAVPDSSPWHATLDRLIRSYAPVGFGRREATSAAFEAAVGPYEHALAVEPLVVAAEGTQR